MASLVSNPLDPRCERTRQNIMNACMSMLAEKPGDSISVSQLAAAAGVNRSTFYLHFRDTENLAESILISLFMSSHNSATADSPENGEASSFSPDSTEQTIFRIVSDLQNRKESYLNLSRMNCFTRILDILDRRIARELAALHPSNPDPEANLLLACACTGILFFSLRNGFPSRDSLVTHISSAFSAYLRIR
jgi:AcrR family transcriptional regulator